MKTLDDVIATLPKARRKAIEEKAQKLIEAETLRQLRAMTKKTQAEVATAMGMRQDRVSKIESGHDMLFSTLIEYIHGLGGEIDVVARLPGRPPVKLTLPALTRS